VIFIFIVSCIKSHVIHLEIYEKKGWFHINFPVFQCVTSRCVG